MNKYVDILQKARGLLVKGWTKGAYARIADNTPVIFSHSNATCWCMVGALYAANSKFVSNNSTGEFYGLRYLWAAITLGNESELTHWNDTPERTINDVLDVYDKAIQLAEISN